MPLESYTNFFFRKIFHSNPFTVPLSLIIMRRKATKFRPKHTMYKIQNNNNKNKNTRLIIYEEQYFLMRASITQIFTAIEKYSNYYSLLMAQSYQWKKHWICPQFNALQFFKIRHVFVY